jgi:hypothetical protein
MDLPLVDSSHEEKCGVCREVWHRSALAYHEATHAAVALDLGLKVEFVAIDEDREVTVTKLEAALYPIIRTGMKIPALCTRLDERSLRDSPEKVLVAMAAPSCVLTGHRQVDDYAGMESFIAVRLMKAKGIDPDEVLDLALRTVEQPVVQDRVLELANGLAETGWVDLT